MSKLHITQHWPVATTSPSNPIFSSIIIIHKIHHTTIKPSVDAWSWPLLSVPPRMRDPLIVVLGGGSSILLPPNPTPPPSHHHQSLSSSSSSSNKPKPSSNHFPAKLSCSSSFSQVSTSTSSTSSSRPPLLMNVRLDLNPSKSNRLKYYADLASKLAENGKFEDFVMMAETVRGLDSESNSFVASLDIKLLSSGFSSVISEGGIESIVEVLSRIQKLGICPSSLFDRSARMSIALECRRILNSGKLEEFVGLMEMLAGFKFSVREFVDPFEVIKMCVEKRVVKLAVRYACILPHASVLFGSIIHGFGKKRDLVSALIAYKESKCHLNSPNMQICRTIIDVCGLCGNSLKSRFIYEELLAQKVTPNNYVFNSLMNVNAHDLSYILHVYKHMQILGAVPDITSYNILLKACCLSGRVELAQDIYMEVKDMASTGALKLDVITYSTIIKVFADAKMWQVALKVKEDMLLAGVTPNVVTWSSLITACANMGLVEQAIQVFEEMLLSGCEPNTQCCNTLLNACVEACQYDRAFRIFQSWKANGIKKSCHPNESNANTGSRVSIGVEYSGGDGISKLVCSDPHRLSFVKVVPFIPTTATYNILMKACGTAYRRAKSLMDEMKTAGLSPDQRSWSTLIDIFGNTGNVGGALQGLKSMRAAGITPDVVAYTTAIKACVANEQLDMAFYLFEEMKEYQLQPNLVTYNTLLRARRRYGSLHEVQQSLAISQHMQKAGYSSNDSFLKDLVEEWCEGVIQNSSQNEQNLGVGDSRDKTNIDKSHRLLLNKVAVHLQKDITESLSIDLRGFSKVEARIVVLAVLRMIKESYALGDTIKDDMVIILGVVKEGSMNHESELQALMVKLLRDELGLDVILTGPRVPVTRSDQRNPPNSDQNHENLGKGKEFVSSARRPAILARLKVTKNSLYSWLEKRVGSSSSSSSSSSSR